MVRYPRGKESFLLLFIALAAHAQTVSSPENQDLKPFQVFRVDVDLVQVDAIVTDSDGKPVSDLTAEDFILYQDGKPQEITSFSSIQNPTSTSSPKVDRKLLTRQKEKGISPPPPPVELKKEQVRRCIALVVDDMGLSFDGIVHTRESLRKWVDSEMQPGDLVAVVSTLSGIGALQQFTADKRMLHAAIDRIVYTTHNRVGVSSFAPVGSEGSGLSGAMKVDNDAALAMGTLESIQYVVSGLKDVPGRKTLILFSESMGMLSEVAEMVRTGSLSPGPQNMVRMSLQRLIEEAHRAAVVIHSIDPRGVVYTGGTAEDSYAGVTAENPEDISEAAQAIMRDVPRQRTTQLLSSQDSMVQLANATGGIFEQGRNDIYEALREVANDGEVYYLLGYKPDRETVLKLKKDGRQFHSVRVRVKRPGLKVRSRSGFFLEPETEDAPLSRRDRLADALHSPFNSGTLPVRLTALFSQTKDNQPCINALLHFYTDKMFFTEEDGWQEAKGEIIASLFDAKGEQVETHDRIWTIMAKGDAFNEMQKNGVAYLMRIPVKKPGAYQMRVVIGDAGSEQLGSAAHFIEIPDLGKVKLALSGIALAAEREPTEAIGDGEEGLVANREVKGTAAVRIFRPGNTLTWAYQAINVTTGKDNRSHLQAYVRLFHEGKEIYAGQPSDISGPMPGNAGKTVLTGRMKLNKISPGDYILQVVVQDLLAGKNPRVAWQSIDFSVEDPATLPVVPLRSLR